MKLAVISDIHSNLTAFNAVLDDLEEKEYDKLVCCGDIVGYNPWPKESLKKARDECDIIIQGNHDRNVQNPSNYRTNEMAYKGLVLANEELSDEEKTYLEELPTRKDLDDVIIVHSHPDKELLGEYVMPRDFPRMRRYMDDYSTMILGHTHIQHEATVDGRLIFNPGSVGQPRDNDPRAAYALLDTSIPEVEFHRVKYQITEVKHAARDKDLPQRTYKRLYHGK